MNAIAQTDEFKKWLKGLRDQMAKAKILVRIKRLDGCNMGDATRFAGVSEHRIDYAPG